MNSGYPKKLCLSETKLCGQASSSMEKVELTELVEAINRCSSEQDQDCLSSCQVLGSKIPICQIA